MFVFRFFCGVRSFCAVFERFFVPDYKIEFYIFLLLVEFWMLLRKSWPSSVLLLMYCVLCGLGFEAGEIFWIKLRYLLRVS